jgi:hypothetical protein
VSWEIRIIYKEMNFNKLLTQIVEEHGCAYVYERMNLTDLCYALRCGPLAIYYLDFENLYIFKFLGTYCRGGPPGPPLRGTLSERLPLFCHIVFPRRGGHGGPPLQFGDTNWSGL